MGHTQWEKWEEQKKWKRIGEGGGAGEGGFIQSEGGESHADTRVMHTSHVDMPLSISRVHPYPQECMAKSKCTKSVGHPGGGIMPVTPVTPVTWPFRDWGGSLCP